MTHFCASIDSDQQKTPLQYEDSAQQHQWGESGPFLISNDSSLVFPVAPDLSAASGPLGNWLTDPANLNSNWNALASIPNSWTVGTEVATIYQFDFAQDNAQPPGNGRTINDNSQQA